MLSIEEQNKLREEEEKRRKEAEEQKKLIEAMMKQRQSQQSSGGGPSPMQGASMYSKFAGGGGGGAGGGGSALGAAAPWLGIAALGVANEIGQTKAGNRSEDTGEYIGDLLTGKVIEQDVTRLTGDDKDDFAVVGTEFMHPIRGPKNFFEDPERYLKFWEYF